VNPAQVWSYGGGTQTAAIAALVISGILPRPDLIVMADTGREKTATWDYLEQVIQPALEAVNLKVDIAPSSLKTVDLWSKGGDLLPPMWTTQNGHGQMKGFCSGEWKRRVVLRYLRQLGVKSCVNWLGISTDEAHRQRPTQEKWVQHWYPLIERGVSRDRCYTIVQRMGWPEPPKSSCWMCPHMRDAQWRQMRDQYPADFDKAVALERDIQSRDPHAWLTKHARPLETLTFGDDQPELFPVGCGEGVCWT
jgi:hypothetical protein